MIGRLVRWLRIVQDRARFERDLEAELQFHCEQRSQQLRGQGMDPAAARRQARIDLGMVGMHRDAVRHARGLAFWDSFTQALRLGWRSLWRTPGFTASAIVVLALPLAALVMMYAMFASYAMSTPPMERPERWVYLEGLRPDQTIEALFVPELARALRQDPPHQLEGVFIHVPVWERLTTATEHRGLGAAVSDDFFSLMGVPMRMGRAWFGRDDGRDADAVILSEIGWRKLFDSAPDVVGRRLDIGERAYTVIGVAGDAFAGIMEVGSLYFVREQDYPRAVLLGQGGGATIEVGGFLREGASLEALNASLHARAQSLTASAPAEERLAAIRAVVRLGILRAEDRKEAMLAGVPIGILVALILVAAAANLANLVLARFSARRHDLGLRAALGAGRMRLFVHLLTECLLLGLVAGAVAMALVFLLIQPLHGLVFGLLSEMGLDLLPVRFGIGAGVVVTAASLLCALAFGALPAWWEATRGAVARRGTSEAIVVGRVEPRGVRGSLMTLQLATSVFLVVIAGLVASNMHVVTRAELGFDPAPLVAIRGRADGGALAEALSRHPAVAQVAATSSIPFASPMPGADALLDSRTERVRVRYVDAAWWSVLDLPVAAGREFHAGERASSSISAVVSRHAAERLWPGRMPLGMTLRLQGGEGDELVIDRRVEVAGVVEDHATGWLIGDAARAVVYLPATAGSEQAPVLLLRMRDATPARLTELQRECRRLDPAAGCEPLRLSDALRVQRVPFIVANTLATTLAWLALGISCVGLYGLVSFAVVQRRRALGVRLALGASDREVILHVMRDALLPLAAGLFFGLVGAWGASRVLAHLTEYLRTTSFEAFVLYPCVLLLFAMAASWWPARHSTRIPLAECLRST